MDHLAGDCGCSVRSVLPDSGGVGTCNSSRTAGADGVIGNGDDVIVLPSGASCELSCSTG